jgi:hypothetical protein
MIRALSKTTDLRDVKEIRAWAELAHRFAQTAGLGFKIQNSAAELKLRAERRASELLADLVRSCSFPSDLRSNSSGSLQIQLKANVDSKVGKRDQSARPAPLAPISSEGSLLQSFAARSGHCGHSLVHRAN